MLKQAVALAAVLSTLAATTRAADAPTEPRARHVVAEIARASAQQSKVTLQMRAGGERKGRVAAAGSESFTLETRAGREEVRYEDVWSVRRRSYPFAILLTIPAAIFFILHNAAAAA